MGWRAAPGSRRRLRVLSVVAPLAGLALLYALRLALIQRWPQGVADAAIGALVTAGVLAFSSAVFRIIDRQDRHLARQYADLEARYASERRLRAQLEALHQAALAIASAQSAPEILQRLVDLACELIGARYGALGVLDTNGGIGQFYTAGIDAQTRAAIGSPPQGHGLLGVTLTEGASLRLADLTSDPRARGFPPGHPPMRSLLAVPVAHAGHVVGNLYLTECTGADAFGEEDERLLYNDGTTYGTQVDGADAFGEEDERLLRLLASHAAVVIRQARLAEQVRLLAVGAERERIRRDLHDGVIQAIYGVNLELEGAEDDLEQDPPAARARIDAAIDRLGEVMKDIRRYILAIPDTEGAGSLPERLAALLAEARAHTLLETELEVSGPVVGTLSPGQQAQLLQIAREAVANAVRHARASRLQLGLEVSGEQVCLRVTDNGAGFDPAVVPGRDRQGLQNMRARAAELGGALAIQTQPGRGTTVEVRAPIASGVQEDAYA